MISKLVITLLIGVLVNATVAVLVPTFAVPPRWEAQQAKAVLNFAICLVPLFYALIILNNAKRPVQVVGWICLVPGSLWLVYSILVLTKAFG